MQKNTQTDLFRDTKAFPDNLFEINKFEATKHFKAWFDIFDHYIQSHKKNKEVKDKLSKDIAQEILDRDSIDRIDDLESTIQERLDIEITHGVIRYFFIEQAHFFLDHNLSYSDIEKIITQRKKRMAQVDLDDMSPNFREKIETSITFFEIIDEELTRAFKMDIYE